MFHKTVEIFLAAILLSSGSPATGAPGAGDLITHMQAVGNTFSPDGDGILDSLVVNYTLADTALSVSAVVLEADTSQAQIRRIFSSRPESAGDHSFSWDGTDSTGTLVPEGHYVVLLEASNETFQESEAETVHVDLTSPSVAITRTDPGVFAPDIPTLPSTFTVEFTVYGSPPGEGDELDITIRNPSGTALADLLPDSAFTGSGSYTAHWDGAEIEDDGMYKVEVIVKDNGGHSSSDWASINCDKAPPEIGITSPENPSYLAALPESLSGWVWDRNGVDRDSVRVRYPDSSFVEVPAKWTVVDTVFFSLPLAGVIVEEGEHIILLRALDSLGRAAQTSFQVTLDTTAPPAPVLQEPRSMVTRSSSYEVSGTAGGEASFVMILRNESPLDSIASLTGPDFSIEVPLLPGENRLAAYSRDMAGNTSDLSNTIELLFDDSPGLSVVEPFRPGDSFDVNLASTPDLVELRIYDLGGDLVRTERLRPDATSFSIPWDGTNGDGERVKRGPLAAVLRIHYRNGHKETFREIFLYSP